MLSWRVKKQLSYLFAALLIFGVIAGFFVWKQLTRGTCFDNRKNQGEAGIDCGGPCDPCPENLREPLVLWSRFFPIGQNTYDTAALIENLNRSWGSGRIVYSFKLYDEDNILIVERNGSTFLNAKERALIFESGLYAGQRKPARLSFEIEPIGNWKYTEKTSPRFIVTRKEFDVTSSILETEIRNETSLDLKDVYLAAVLLNKEGNAFAASVTKINRIAAGSKAGASFTWRETFKEEPARIEVFSRIKAIK